MLCVYFKQTTYTENNIVFFGVVQQMVPTTSGLSLLLS